MAQGKPLPDHVQAKVKEALASEGLKASALRSGASCEAVARGAAGLGVRDGTAALLSSAVDVTIARSPQLTRAARGDTW